MAGEGRSLDLRRGGIAVLDSGGKVTWTDEAWASDGGEGGLPRPPIGANLLESYNAYAGPIARAVANAIVAVFERRATYFEIEHGADRESERYFLLTSVTALRGDGAGAVVIHRVLDERTPSSLPRRVDVMTTTTSAPTEEVERLTPREREVLGFMAAGLDNRTIATEIGIQYTTVRGHVRSVIEKLGARSRLEAVARAYRNGWVENR